MVPDFPRSRIRKRIPSTKISIQDIKFGITGINYLPGGEYFNDSDLILDKLTIKNFKSIVDETLKLNDTTYIAGVNSAGKSSFTQALLLILQWINGLSSGRPSVIPINGALLKLGNSVDEIINRNQSTKNQHTSNPEISLNFLPKESEIRSDNIDKNNLIPEINELSIVFNLKRSENSKSAFEINYIKIEYKLAINNKNLASKDSEENLTLEWNYQYSDQAFTELQVFKSKVFTTYFSEYAFNQQSDKIAKTAENKDWNNYINNLELNPNKIRPLPSLTFSANDNKNFSTTSKLVFPKNLRVTEQSPVLESGLFGNLELKLDENSLKQVLIEKDILKLALFQKFATLLQETPSDLDNEYEITRNLLAIKLENFSGSSSSGKAKTIHQTKFLKDIIKSATYKVKNAEQEYLVSKKEISVKIGEKLYEVFTQNIDQDDIGKLRKIRYDGNEEKVFLENLAKFIQIQNLSTTGFNFNFEKQQPHRNRWNHYRTIRGKIFENTSSSIFNPLYIFEYFNNNEESKNYQMGDAWSDELYDIIASKESIEIENIIFDSIKVEFENKGGYEYFRTRSFTMFPFFRGLSNKDLEYLYTTSGEEKLKNPLNNFSILSKNILQSFDQIFDKNYKMLSSQLAPVFSDLTESTNFSYFAKELEKLLEISSKNIFKNLFDTYNKNSQQIFCYFLLKNLTFNVSRPQYLNTAFTSNNYLNNYTKEIFDSEDLLFLGIPNNVNRDSYLVDKKIFDNFSFLSSSRGSKNSNFLISENIAPSGINGEFIEEYLKLNGENLFSSPIPPKGNNSIKFNSKNTNEKYQLKQILSLWLSFIFDKPLNIELDYTQEKVTVNKDELINIGSGVSQVVPILVQLIVSEGKTIFLEEVEQNLHARAQAKLAEAILLFSMNKRRIVVETHSDHIVNKLRLSKIQMSENENSPEFSIYFTTNDSVNGSKLSEMKVSEQGEFLVDKIPEGFFDQYQNDAIEIIRALSVKKSDK